MKRKKNPEERAREISLVINRVKETLHNFTQDDLNRSLKDLNCPYRKSIFSILRQKNLIVKTGDIWNFFGKEPIHFRIIQADIDKLANAGLGYCQTHYEKKKLNQQMSSLPALVEAASEVIENKRDLADEELISYLKSKGYKILRPVTNYEEV